MIRMTFYLRRKSDLSRAEFQDYWRNQHGPLVAGFSSALAIHRYVQVHTQNDPINDAMNKARGGGMEPVYDGVAEIWWEDEATLTRALATEAGAIAGASLLEDEKKFIDLPRSPLYLAYEYPQVNPSPENIIAHEKNNLLKIHFPLRHLPSLNEEAVRHYWLTNHGPIIRSHAPASGILRYIQVHRAGHELDAQLRASRNTEVEAYLGHAEVWIDRKRMGTPEGAVANLAAIEDEAKFIDFSRSTIFVGKEIAYIDRR